MEGVSGRAGAREQVEFPLAISFHLRKAIWFSSITDGLATPADTTDNDDVGISVDVLDVSRFAKGRARRGRSHPGRLHRAWRCARSRHPIVASNCVVFKRGSVRVSESC